MAEKDQIAPNEIFSRKTTNKIFMFLLARFILQNLKKTLRADQCYEDVSFSTPKWPIYPEQNFYFHLPIGPFHCAKFKKILTVDPELC